MGDIDPGWIMRIPRERIEKPMRGMCEVFMNSWWVYDPKTDCVIFYQRHKPEYSSPQCHNKQGIAEKVHGPIWKPFGFELRQIPAAFVPIWTTGDYDFGYQLVRLLMPDNVLEEM